MKITIIIVILLRCLITSEQNLIFTKWQSTKAIVHRGLKIGSERKKTAYVTHEGAARQPIRRLRQEVSDKKTHLLHIVATPGIYKRIPSFQQYIKEVSKMAHNQDPNLFKPYVVVLCFSSFKSDIFPPGVNSLCGSLS